MKSCSERAIVAGCLSIFVQGRKVAAQDSYPNVNVSLGVSMKHAQFTLRNGGKTAHVQVGKTDDYSKFDLPANDAIRSYYENALKNGETYRSLANTSTQYASVEVREKVSRQIVIPAQTITIPETVLGCDED